MYLKLIGHLLIITVGIPPLIIYSKVILPNWIVSEMAGYWCCFSNAIYF